MLLQFQRRLRTVTLFVASAALIASGLGVPDPTWAQATAPGAASQPGAGAPPQSVAVADDQGNLTQPQLERLLAPIALYPDELLMQVLMAATYPLEIVQARRWLADRKNAQLHGDALAQALAKEPWDPSVKSLVPFPDVLAMMNDQLDWTQQLGDAVLAQQNDVMNAVQVLRSRAQASGALKSGPQQTVTVEQKVGAPAVQSAPAQGAAVVAPPPEVITIAPTDPGRVYVPAYNPSVVYGAWPYPAYPPVYYPPPVGAQVGTALLTGMAFAGGVAVVNSLWGWARPGWGGGNIDVNVNRFNTINANRPAINNGTWQHDVAHRHGVAYRNDQVRARVGAGRTGAAAGRAQAREQFRGRVNHPAQGIGGRAGGGQARTNLAERRPQNAGQRARTQQRSGGEHVGGRPAGQRQGAGQRPGIQHRASGRPQFQGAAAGRGPSGFQGVGQGSGERAAAMRGQMSRQGQPAARARVQQRSTGARGGGFHGGGGGFHGGGGGFHGGRRR